MGGKCLYTIRQSFIKFINSDTRYNNKNNNNAKTSHISTTHTIVFPYEPYILSSDPYISPIPT